MSSRILLVEDNDNLSAMLRRFLTSQGYDVDTAADGTTALRAVIAAPPALLLLDLRLPGMSGAELVQTLRRDHPALDFPIIFMSGVYKGEKCREGARRLGVTRYLEKPFSPPQLLQTVTAALAETRPAEEPPPPAYDVIKLFEERRTGTFTAAGHPPVSFISGEPVTFTTRTNRQFAAYLADKGKITRDEEEQYAAGGAERLRYTQAGLLTFEELVEESRLFLGREILAMVENGVTGTFIEGAADLELPVVYLSLPRLYYDAAKVRTAQVNPAAFTARYGGLYPARTQSYYRQANLISMGEDDIGLLQRMDGATPLTQIIAGADQRPATAFFNYLLTLGMIGFHPTLTAEAAPDFPQKQIFNRPLETPPAEAETAVGFDDLVQEVADSVILVPDDSMGAPLSAEEIGFEQAVLRDQAFIEGKNYYELFDLTPGSFSFNALKDAYFGKTRQYSPERFMELSGSTLAIAQEILSVYSSAYNTLSNVIAKERYDELLNADRIGLGGQKDDKLHAEIQFQSGNVFLEMGEFDNAEKALQDAYTLEPDNARHCAFLAWAIHRNPANANSRAAQDRSRSLLGKALTLGRCPEAFTFRGLMLLEEGRDGLAEGEFQKALKLNPRDQQARKGLQQIIDRRESEKKGLFRKLFKQ